MKEQHTPGPWHWGYFDLSDRLFIAHQDDANPEHTGFLAEMQKYNGNEADARLIAAAPELLEALRKTLCYLECDSDDHQERADHKEAREAIAKAMGETL